jgi:hypothetical protein
VPSADRLVDEPELAGSGDQPFLESSDPAVLLVQKVTVEDVEHPTVAVVHDIGDVVVLVQPVGHGEVHVGVGRRDDQIHGVVPVDLGGGCFERLAPGTVADLGEPELVEADADLAPDLGNQGPQRAPPPDVSLQSGPVERDANDLDARVDQCLQGDVDAGEAAERLTVGGQNRDLKPLPGKAVSGGQGSVDPASSARREAPGHIENVRSRTR